MARPIEIVTARVTRWIAPEVVPAFLQRPKRRGYAEAVAPCTCSHPWGLHTFAKPHMCLITGCECNAFEAKDPPHAR